MKSVLISVQPKWCKLILKCMGWENQRPFYKKRLELRKTAPEPPFKAYIYCTKGKNKNDKFQIAHKGNNYLANGKVIAEFTCDYVLNHCEMANADIMERMSCVPREDILKYANGKNVRGWCIDRLVIYDKPKELSEFFIYCGENPKCDGCEAHYYSNTECGKEDYCCSVIDGCRPLKRPPQSWCYVEGVAGK